MFECDGETASFNSREHLLSMGLREYVSEYVKTRRTEIDS